MWNANSAAGVRIPASAMTTWCWPWVSQLYHSLMVASSHISNALLRRSPSTSIYNINCNRYLKRIDSVHSILTAECFWFSCFCYRTTLRLAFFSLVYVFRHGSDFSYTTAHAYKYKNRTPSKNGAKTEKMTFLLAIHQHTFLPEKQRSA